MSHSHIVTMADATHAEDSAVEQSEWKFTVMVLFMFFLHEGTLLPVLQHDAGSSTANEEQAEWEKWRQLKEAVESEVSQCEWRNILTVTQDHRDHSTGCHAKAIITIANFTNGPHLLYREVNQVENTASVSDAEVAQWHLLWNATTRPPSVAMAKSNLSA